eukprot:3984523-Amphidinium_carterae.1
MRNPCTFVSKVSVELTQSLAFKFRSTSTLLEAARPRGLALSWMGRDMPRETRQHRQCNSESSYPFTRSLSLKVLHAKAINNKIANQCQQTKHKSTLTDQ